jgi:tripartite-type tricarboxylate transporter receptor subunit TctC
MELVEYRGRMHLLHVAYRGGPAALAGLMAGDVDMALEGSLGTLPLIRAGRLRAIAVSGARRLDALPDVPTFAEAGIRGIENAWMGVIAPARTPPAIVERLHAEIVRALDAPDVRASYEASARLRIGNSPGEFAALIAHSTPAWRELVRVAGLKPE